MEAASEGYARVHPPCARIAEGTLRLIGVATTPTDGMIFAVIALIITISISLNPSKMNHGGKRPGSGRKPKPDKGKTCSFVIDPPELVEKIKNLAREAGLSKSAWISGLIKRAKR